MCLHATPFHCSRAATRPRVTGLVFCISVLVHAAAYGLETPLELQPYRVQLVLADGRDIEATRDSLAGDVHLAVDRTWGGRWDFQLESRSPSPWSNERSFRQFDPAAMVTDPADVHYFVRVTQQAAALQLQVRAWEPLWSYSSPVLTATVLDPRDAPQRLMELTRDLFRPRAVWQKTDDYSANITVQGAALAVPDPEFPILLDREIFTPWIIARKRDGGVQRQQAVPWTYFVAGKLSDGRGAVRVVSGLRAPLGAKPRGRIEYTAVAARAQWPATALECWSQAQPPQPLAAHRIEVTPVELDPQQASEEAPPPSPMLMITDRVGRVTLKTAAVPMMWTSIYSGTLKLARVPVVPGSQPATRIDLPDDAIRLRAEGQLQLIQSELVDAVALRSVLIAAARSEAKKSNWAGARERIAAAKTLNSPQQFTERISGVRVPAVAAALQRNDRTTEQRVIRMCEETAELVRRYLDPDRIRLIQEEVDELEAAERQTREDVKQLPKERPEDLPRIVVPATKSGTNPPGGASEKTAR